MFGNISVSINELYVRYTWKFTWLMHTVNFFFISSIEEYGKELLFICLPFSQTSLY